MWWPISAWAIPTKFSVTPTNLIDQLVRDEGEILHEFKDSRGFSTIGSGICIDLRAGCGITHEENLYLLNNRAEKARAAVRTQLPWSLKLDEVRRAVFEAMAFNMGIEHLLEFRHLLTAASMGDFKTAAAAGLDSLWAKEVGDRAHRLMKQLETGEWV
jgi:lysozyme